MAQFLAFSKKSESCRQLEIRDQLQRRVLIHAAQEPFERGPLKMAAAGVEITIELILETSGVGHRNPNAAAIAGHPFDLAQRGDGVGKVLESEIDYSEIENAVARRNRRCYSLSKSSVRRKILHLFVNFLIDRANLHLRELSIVKSSAAAPKVENRCACPERSHQFAERKRALERRFFDHRISTS